MTVATPPATDQLEACFDKLRWLHPQLCPRQVLGVRIGMLAASVLDLDLPRRDKRVLAFVETDGCFADAVSVATGCWLGRRTLRLMDYGRVAATLVDTVTHTAIRVRPHLQARTRALGWAPHETDRWSAQLLGYQLMPALDLLDIESVVLTATALADMLGSAGRTTCCACGEEILNRREVRANSGVRCRACASGAYYVPAQCG